MPEISISVPVYNVDLYFAECVDSVLRQTYSDIETLLVDDGSTDCGSEMCDEYVLANTNIVAYHKTNGGLSSARNTGMDAATGEYLYFLDSDDYIADNAIEILVNQAQTDNADMVFFDGITFHDGCEDSGRPDPYQRSRQYGVMNGRNSLLMLLNNDEYRTAVPLFFYKKSYITDNSLRFYESIIHEDEHFSCLTFMADGTAAHCHENLYFRRMRPGSIMTSGKVQYAFNSMLKIYYDLSERYRDKDFICETSRVYLVRTAKGVIAKYKMLDEAGQIACQEVYQSFRKSVMRFHGFGDMKLKIKCSDGLAKFFYRLENKFLGR